MDTLAQRFARLEPFITRYGPAGETKRPAVVLFHGCGGMRPHVHDYAKATADALPVRVYVVDSFAPRGWDRLFATSLICTGAVMQGYERAGDVLAVLWGLKRDPKVDADNLVLGGFSHGGWSIMDLMTAPLLKAGEVKITDPDPALIDGVKGVFLVYPYANFPARTEHHDWQRKPEVYWVVAGRDHLTPAKKAHALMDKLRAQGVVVSSLDLDATHAFDEEGSGPIMRHSPEAQAAAETALIDFSRRVLGSS